MGRGVSALPPGPALSCALDLSFVSSSRPPRSCPGLQALRHERDEVGHRGIYRAALGEDHAHEVVEGGAVGVREVGVGDLGRLVVGGVGEGALRGSGGHGDCHP